MVEAPAAGVASGFLGANSDGRAGVVDAGAISRYGELFSKHRIQENVPVGVDEGVVPVLGGPPNIEGAAGVVVVAVLAPPNRGLAGVVEVEVPEAGVVPVAPPPNSPPVGVVSLFPPNIPPVPAPPV